jgi:hypothetical protein
MTEQYCHASGSGVTPFSTLKTPSNVMDIVAPIHVMRQRYWSRQRRWHDEKVKSSKFL